jgi:cell division protein FtsN
MEKYLQLLLKEVNTVILPGLGALTITNHATGEILFMPYLKYDDGKLSTFISVQAGMSGPEAKELVESSIREILNEIEGGARKEIAGLGVFSKNTSGDIDFESKKSEMKEAPLLDEEYLQATIAEEEEVIKDSMSDHVADEEEIIDEPIVVEEIFQENIEAPVVSEFEEEKVEEVVSEDELILAVSPEAEFTPEEECKIEVLASEEEVEESKNGQEDIESATIEEKIVISVELNELESPEVLELVSDSEETIVQPKKKKKFKIFAIVLVVIAIVGSGAYVGLNFEEITHSMGSESHEENSSEDEIIESAEKSVVTPEEVQEGEGKEMLKIEEEGLPSETNEPATTQKVKEETVPQRSSGALEPNDVKQTFYIVLGSFSDKSNADKMVAKLISDGKSGATTVDRGGKYSVSLTSYSNIDDANEKIEGHKVEFPHAWILKM